MIWARGDLKVVKYALIAASGKHNVVIPFLLTE